MTEAGQSKASKFIARENISGFVIDKLNGNYDCITNGAHLNLGDSMILSTTIHQSLHALVIPTENENFSFRVPSTHSSLSCEPESPGAGGGGGGGAPSSLGSADFRLEPMGGASDYFQ